MILAWSFFIINLAFYLFWHKQYLFFNDSLLSCISSVHYRSLVFVRYKQVAYTHFHSHVILARVLSGKFHLTRHSRERYRIVLGKMLQLATKPGWFSKKTCQRISTYLQDTLKYCEVIWSPVRRISKRGTLMGKRGIFRISITESSLKLATKLRKSFFFGLIWRVANLQIVLPKRRAVTLSVDSEFVFWNIENRTPDKIFSVSSEVASFRPVDVDLFGFGFFSKIWLSFFPFFPIISDVTNNCFYTSMGKAWSSSVSLFLSSSKQCLCGTLPTTI